MPSIKFDDVKTELLPADKYLATIVDAKDGQSAAGNPKIDIQWKIEGGAHDGRRVFDTMSFHPKALYRTKATLVALGWSKNFSGDVTAPDLIGKTAYILVSIKAGAIDPDTNEPYADSNQVKSVRSLKAPGTPVTDTPAPRKGFLNRG